MNKIDILFIQYNTIYTMALNILDSENLLSLKCIKQKNFFFNYIIIFNMK